MSEFKIYSVKDELNEAFMQPIFTKSEKDILRLFEYQINNTKIWKDNPSDFSLYLLGHFNEVTGELGSEIKKIAGGRSVLRKENNDLQSDRETENQSE